jgi:two-component system NarL family sensor kinase
MDHVLAVGLTVAALSFAGSGAALVLVRRAVLSGVLVLATGLLVVAGLATDAAGRTDASHAAFVTAGMLTAALALATYPVARRGSVDLAAYVVLAGLGLASLAWESPEVVGSAGISTAMVLVAHTWWRLETAAGPERRALVWMSLTVVAAGLVLGITSFATEGGDIEPLVGVLAVVGPALYVGVVLPDIVDVRGVVVSVVVLAVAVVTYISVFAGVAAVLELVTGDVPAVGALAVVGALVAMTFGPLQVMLRGVVDELLFGRRPDPLDAASRVAGQVGDDPAQALRAIREALVLPYAALRADGHELAASGTADTHTRTFPLEGAGAELIVGLRPGDLSLSRGDEHVLRLVAPLLAQALRARALASDLQESREATITAVEDERRRLRRDLHDGLGPRLSGIAFTSDAVRNLVRADPDAADALLVQLRADTTTAIEDIRRLVYAMRPPALDELGLVPALRQQCVGLRASDGRAVRVELLVPEELPLLSAAVEVAAYRIVVEALTNAARHAGTAHVTASLRLEGDSLRLQVDDHGGPSATEWTPGVGLASMLERATELGGTLTAGPTADGGRVSAALPLG